MTVDLTKLTAPLGLLDEFYGEGTRAALMKHGGPYEVYGGTWEDVDASWLDDFTYRVKPQPLTKPDIPWHLMADWVQYVARDEGGEVNVYEKRPDQDDDCWFIPEGMYCSLRALKIDPGTCDWRDSLVKRPEGK